MGIRREGGRERGGVWGGGEMEREGETEGDSFVHFSLYIVGAIHS